MKSRIIVLGCVLISLIFISYGVYLKIYALNDANAYLLIGGTPLLGYLLSVWFKKLGIQK